MRIIEFNSLDRSINSGILEAAPSNIEGFWTLFNRKTCDKYPA